MEIRFSCDYAVVNANINKLKIISVGLMILILEVTLSLITDYFGGG